MLMVKNRELLPANTQRLIDLGEAIFGKKWQNATARALKVPPAQINRWLRGEYIPSEERLRQLDEVGRQKIVEITKKRL